MRAFDLNFARAAKIFDPNFMRAGRKPARLCDKIPSSARALRGDEILSSDGILSDRALNIGEILSGGGILRDCEISSGSGILNETSRGGIRYRFCRWILRELCGEASPLRLCRKFQSASGSQTDCKFKRVFALQTDRKFKMAVSLRTACKFKASMQKFHYGTCAAAKLLRQKFRSETVSHNRLKFQSSSYVLARSKFGDAMSEIGARVSSASLKFQISVVALLQLKFGGVPYATPQLKFQSAVVAEFARSKFKGSSRAAQCCKIRAQGQGG